MDSTIMSAIIQGVFTIISAVLGAWLAAKWAVQAQSPKPKQVRIDPFKDAPIIFQRAHIIIFIIGLISAEIGVFIGSGIVYVLSLGHVSFYNWWISSSWSTFLYFLVARFLPKRFLLSFKYIIVWLIIVALFDPNGESFAAHFVGWVAMLGTGVRLYMWYQKYKKGSVSPTTDEPNTEAA